MEQEAYKVIVGDCLEVLRRMGDCSVDAIVTDPPYGISFMGKRWDYDVPSVEVWAECLRVLKPGGHLLAFAGTRTQHRIAVRIEDAGFEIRDMIAWVYGSGFPKSLDVSKALDKINAEAGRLHKFTEWMRSTGVTAKQINDATGTFMATHYLTAGSQPAIPTPELWAIIRPMCGEVPVWIDDLVERIAAKREVVGQKRGVDTSKLRIACSTAAQGFDKTPRRAFNITAPATEASRTWSGWGTALKPALEPITVARKPLIGTVAENVLAHGTGAINVDGCRVGDNAGWSYPNGRGGTAWHGRDSLANNLTEPMSATQGRWPANLIHDGSEEVTELFPCVNGVLGARREGGDKSIFSGGGHKQSEKQRIVGGIKDTGSAARFFYCAKASKADRDEGLEGFEARARPTMGSGIGGQPDQQKANNRNIHPTVKPTALMRYLCRLVTPPGGLVLDPFTGSGSTGKAAILEGFRFLGIERDPEYVKIAEARINSAFKSKSEELL